MVFDIDGKVALVTGGASGMGNSFVKELLHYGAKGVTIADINEKFGKVAVKEVEEEYGSSKVLFVKTDVSDRESFEEAFQKTLDKFGNIDILINNAGIANEYTWEKIISTNMNGVVHGTTLGLDKYLSRHKQGPEAVIVNISSIAGFTPYCFLPVYCGTKFAILGMSRCWGQPFHYQRTKVRVIAACPGATTTPIADKPTEITPYQNELQAVLAETYFQPAEHVAREVMKLIQDSPIGSAWVIEDEKPAYEHTA